MKFCSKCGAQIPEDARFCKQCGTPVSNVEKPAGVSENKSNTTKIIIIALIAAVLIGGGVFWFFHWNKTKGEDHHRETIGDSVANSKEVVAQAVVAEENLSEALNAFDGARQQDDAAQQQITDLDAVPGIVHYMHTDDYPTGADMRWYTGDVMRNGVPSGVNRISNLEDAMDGWKAIIYNDLGNKNGCENIEFVNINIGGNEANLRAKVTTFARYDVSTEEVSTFDNDVVEYKGKWQNGKFSASGAGTINITDMWEKDNHQYAIGTFDSPDGIPALIAMVRSARVY